MIFVSIAVSRKPKSTLKREDTLRKMSIVHQIAINKILVPRQPRRTSTNRSKARLEVFEVDADWGAQPREGSHTEELVSSVFFNSQNIIRHGKNMHFERPVLNCMTEAILAQSSAAVIARNQHSRFPAML